MGRFAVFSVFIVAVTVSGAYAGLLPDILPVPDIPILPDIIPSPNSKEDAISTLNRGASAGKSGINIRISAFIGASNRDASLTPASKECIAEKANQLRSQTLAGIDDTVASLQVEIQAGSDAWLGVWLEIIADLPNLILSILTNLQDSLNTAKSNCIDQTASAAAA